MWPQWPTEPITFQVTLARNPGPPSTGVAFAETDGGLATIDYSEDQIMFDPPFDGAAVGALFVVVQGGSTYTTPIIERIERRREGGLYIERGDTRT